MYANLKNILCDPGNPIENYPKKIINQVHETFIKNAQWSIIYNGENLKIDYI